MNKKEEIENVIKWCEKKKLEVGRTPILELNPFKDIEWLRNKTLIQIDRPRELADKNGIVYESTIRRLYEYFNGIWREIK